MGTSEKQQTNVQFEKEEKPKQEKKADLFPGNIEVYKLVYDEEGMPSHYVTVQVPEEAATAQLSKPKKSRQIHWQDFTFKKDADTKKYPVQ